MTKPVQSVVRAFDLMRVLSAADEPMGLGDLAHAVQLPKSTARRLLATLQTVDAVQRGAHGRYSMATPAGALGPAGEGAVHLVASPFLRDVVDMTGEDATLAVLDQNTVIYLEQVSGPNPIQVPDGTGLRLAPHEVSSGLVLMAGWPSDRIDAYCTRVELDQADIRPKLDAVARDGYVWHIDRWVEGVSAVAAPVHNGVGEVVAAIGALGPTYRFPGAVDQSRLGGQVAAVARRLERLIA